MNQTLFDNSAKYRSRGAAGKPGTSITEHTLRGEVLRIVFASADGQYAVLRLRDTDGRERTLIGPLDGVMAGQDIEAVGHWETHKEHGRQFRVSRFRAVLPSSREGIIRYLASGLIHGIGPKFAERIVEHFGTDTLDVLDNYTNRLKEVPGIGKKRIAEIRKAWRKHSDQREIMVFLQGLGLSAAYCARIISRYGQGAAEIVRKNPYQLASDVHGIGFLRADRIAERLGVEKESPLRLSAGITHVLEQLSQEGHVCYRKGPLLTKAAEILKVGLDYAETGLERALLNGTAVCEGSPGDSDALIYRRELYTAEKELTESIRTLLSHSRSTLDISGVLPDSDTAVLNEKQLRAVKTAFCSPISIITGGPGVGKTTVVGYIVKAARRLGRYVMLAAPTGRAAKRLSEATSLEAKTIHRTLKWDPATRSFVHNRDHPLKCSFLVVDEVSMLDVVLANQLFRAVTPGTGVVLVGDRDQLPSVGPGAVLKNLIKCDRMPVTNLIEIFRQEEGSRIVTNAHAVNAGRMPDVRTVQRRLADYYWIDQQDPEKVADDIVRMVAERIPDAFRYNPMTDIQVLTPMHRGTCGAITLNNLLQERLNGGPKPQFRFGERHFRAGDRVMQTSNNYDKGVFNGELGQIVSINSKEKRFKIMFDVGAVEYEWGEADQIKLAYAITIHKSQGSEFPVVIMPVLTQHYVMLQRNLVYTGMTRARKLLIMIGTRKALAIAVGNDQTKSRCTQLTERLKNQSSTDIP